MLDLSDLSYNVVVMDDKKKQYSIREYITNLGWEENEKELSVRISFVAKNDKTSMGYLSGIIKPGCVIGIFASYGKNDDEVARGHVESWNPVQKNSGSTLKCICYDELYALQKSQDNRYYPSGTGTKAAITGVLKDAKIKQGDYKGPDVKHGKKVFNNKYMSDIILEFLDDAEKKGKDKCIVRASKGSACVVPRGNNSDVYIFESDNSQMFGQCIDTTNLITRVKVVGKSKGKDKTSVEETLNGLTKYGIRQRIYTRASDESLKAAKKSAQEILNNEGQIKKEITVQAPDVPYIRKGDLVYIKSATHKGYCYVLSVQHNAETLSMTMTLESQTKDEVVDENKTEKSKKDYEVGDIVNFKGGTHYVSSYPDAKGYSAKAGKAKITKKSGNSKGHPFHLIHTDSKSNVYGWVDSGSFE